VLTHFSARYSGDGSENCTRTMRRIEELARETCGLRGVEDVVAAWDGATLTVPSKAMAGQGQGQGQQAKAFAFPEMGKGK
jgi:hypothetical protein